MGLHPTPAALQTTRAAGRLMTPLIFEGASMSGNRPPSFRTVFQLMQFRCSCSAAPVTMLCAHLALGPNHGVCARLDGSSDGVAPLEHGRADVALFSLKACPGPVCRLSITLWPGVLEPGNVEVAREHPLVPSAGHAEASHLRLEAILPLLLIIDEPALLLSRKRFSRRRQVDCGCQTKYRRRGLTSRWAWRRWSHPQCPQLHFAIATTLMNDASRTSLVSHRATHLRSEGRPSPPTVASPETLIMQTPYVVCRRSCTSPRPHEKRICVGNEAAAAASCASDPVGISPHIRISSSWRL